MQTPYDSLVLGIIGLEEIIEYFHYLCEDLSFKMSELKNFDTMFRLDGKVALITGGKATSVKDILG